MESRKEDDQATHHDVPSESQQRRMSLVLSDVVMMSGWCQDRHWWERRAQHPARGQESRGHPCSERRKHNSAVTSRENIHSQWWSYNLIMMMSNCCWAKWCFTRGWQDVKWKHLVEVGLHLVKCIWVADGAWADSRNHWHSCWSKYFTKLPKVHHKVKSIYLNSSNLP